MGKRTIWREVGERECGRERGGGRGGGEAGLAAASKWFCFCKWLCTDPGLGAPLASPPSSHEARSKWVLGFLWFFSPLRPENLQGYRRRPQVCPHIRWMRSSGVQRVKRFPSTKTWRSRRWQRITSPFAPADHRTDALMAAISFHFIRDDIIANSYTAVIVS